MPTSVVKYNIMIASPSDVQEERMIVREAILAWNEIHSDTKGVVLLPLYWEKAYPKLGDRPQDVINEQMTDKSDLLVAIFWTRVGTETGEYISGSIEEIEKHILLDKPVMIYFSNTPAYPDKIDSSQYGKLLEFKKKISGLYSQYDDKIEFKEKFKDNLASIINDIVKKNSFNQNLMNFTNSEVIVKPKDTQSLFSKEELKILKEWVKSNSDVALLVKTKDACIYMIGHKQYEAKSNRECADWDDYFERLVSEGLILKQYNSKGNEFYKLKKSAFILVDSIN